MANVSFKTGLQSSLDTIRTNLTAVEGTIYLTSDTHRMYIGRITDSSKQTASACDAVPVNEGVTFVSTISNLPTVTSANATQYVGQFYYVADKNILCVYSNSATNGGWVQINPNTDTQVEKLSYSVSVSSGVATITTSVQSTTDTGVSGGKTVSDKMTIQGAGGNVVTASGKAITITGEQYDLNQSLGADGKTVTVNLTSTSGNDNSSIQFRTGDNLTASTDTDGAILLKATDTQLSSMAISNNATAGFDISVTDTGGNTVTQNLKPQIKVGSTTYDFKSGVATLSVYSKSDIDSKMKALNAMTFKGVVDQSTTGHILPTGGSSSVVSIGDTYKASANFTLTTGGTSYTIKKGDLLIATGTESGGVITTDTLVWAIVPSGDDDDTTMTYKFETTTHGVALREYTGGTSGDLVGSLTLAAGAKMVLTDDSNGTGKDNPNRTITVAHATTTVTATSGTSAQSANSDFTFTVVESIGKDSYGHINAITTKKITVKDTNSYVDNLSTQIAAASNVATVTNAARTYNSITKATIGAVASNTYQIKSDTLSITADAATIDSASNKQSKAAVLSVNLTWGTF